ncbi:MAG: DUF6895 family protein [Ornithinibacter sp.]
MSTSHELRRRLAHGLRLGAAGVAVAAEGRPGVGGARVLVPTTVLRETALLCRVAGRLLADEPTLVRFEGLGGAQARLGEALTRALDPLQAGLAVAADPRCRAREAFPFALLGDLDTGHRSVARQLFDLADPDDDDLGEEADPFDRLELSWLQGLAEGCASPDVPAGSVLERGADLLNGDLTDADALTHAVLHATDCGLLAPRSTRPAGSVADDAEALLGAALACGNLDVAAELLWTWPMLVLPLCPGARYALAELDRAEATHGFLPGPEHDRAVASTLSPADRSTYVIQTSYHTAVAGAVLAAALLRRAEDGDRARSGTRPASARRAAPTPDADPLLILRHADGPWASALRSRPLPERVACTELLVGAELRTAAARRDPAQVHLVVAWAAEHGWAHLPSVRQGAALLSRVARVAAQPVSLAG